MTLTHIYMIKQKSTGIPLQEVFFSREDAREGKRMFEQRDGTKYAIVKFQKHSEVC